jgi:hypothetical protein
VYAALAPGDGNATLPTGASRRLLTIFCAGFMFGFLRAPTRFLWRRDAATLARLPIEGTALFDSGWRSCRGDAVKFLLVTSPAVAAIAFANPQIAFGHVSVAAALAFAIAGAGPAACVAAGSIVVAGKTQQTNVHNRVGPTPAPPSALLGGLPGFVGAIIIALIIGLSPSLLHQDSPLSWQMVCPLIALASMAAVFYCRSQLARHLPAILREVSTLDRTYLASLEILPPSRTHSAASKLLSTSAGAILLKNGRLMSRRYPMAGIVGFLLLVLTAFLAWHPATDISWYVASQLFAAGYAAILVRRLFASPITELRLETSLGVTPKAQRSAAAAWGMCWWLMFIAVPSVLAGRATGSAMFALLAPPLAIVWAAVHQSTSAAKVRD